MTLKSFLNGVLNYINKNIKGIQGTLGVYQLMLVIERTFYDASLVVQVTLKNLILIRIFNIFFKIEKSQAV